MNADIEKLATVMGLSQYQKNILKSNSAAYDISHLVKRGDVLYAPRVTHSFIQSFCDLFIGRSADLIGKNKMLVCNRRGVQFFARGFYSVAVGRYKYYADENGDIISRRAFMQRTRNDV